MLNRIWGILLFVGIIGGICNGRVEEIQNAFFDSGKDAVTLALSMAGIVGLWSGLINILQQAGAMDMLGRILRPLLGRIMPSTKSDKEAQQQVLTNIGANFLGLGNGATPSGIKAVGKMQEIHISRGGDRGIASKDVCLFLIINSAAFQLLPTTVLGLRAAEGSADPGSIIIATWIVSAVALIVGVGTFYLENIFGRVK